MSERPGAQADARQREIYELADALLRKVITSEDARRLNELLGSDVEARRHYLRFMHDSAKLCQWSAAWKKENAGYPSSLVPHPLAAVHFRLSSFHGLVAGALVSYVIAAVIMGASILAAWAWKTPGVFPELAWTLPPATEAAGTEATVVGKVTQSIGCRWADPSTSAEIGAAVAPGRTYALASGLLEITYHSGAKVILQGPATYEVETEDSGFLSLGKLTAHVPATEERGEGPHERATSQESTAHSALFCLRIPGGTVTSQGGEFGMDVDAPRHSRAYVFQGAVALRLKNDAGNEVIPVGERHAARIEQLGANWAATVTGNVPPPSTFARCMPGQALKAGDAASAPQVARDTADRGPSFHPAVQDPVEPSRSASGSALAQLTSTSASARQVPEGILCTYRMAFDFKDAVPGEAELHISFVARKNKYVSAIRFNGKNVPLAKQARGGLGQSSGELSIKEGILEGTNTIEADVLLVGPRPTTAEDMVQWRFELKFNWKNQPPAGGPAGGTKGKEVK